MNKISTCQNLWSANSNSVLRRCCAILKCQIAVKNHKHRAGAGHKLMYSSHSEEFGWILLSGMHLCLQLRGQLWIGCIQLMFVCRGRQRETSLLWFIDSFMVLMILLSATSASGTKHSQENQWWGLYFVGSQPKVCPTWLDDSTSTSYSTTTCPPLCYDGQLSSQWGDFLVFIHFFVSVLVWFYLLALSNCWNRVMGDWNLVHY